MPNKYFYAYRAYPTNNTERYDAWSGIWQSDKDTPEEVFEEIRQHVAAKYLTYANQVLITAFNKVT